MTGQRLGHYQITVQLGAGGMGEVYRARDSKLERDVAIKVLPRGFATDRERMSRFEQEARTLASLNHPNILVIFETGVHEGAPYLVSELLDGRTLRNVLADGPLPSRRAVEYASQIAHGLAAAHDKGVIHRDLKPENLFITHDGRVKILDFGLAKLLDDSNPKRNMRTLAPSETPTLTEATKPGVVLGTPGYMSPEQVRGGAVEEVSDIFAFGAILYEMLCGQRAFPGESSVEVMHAILSSDPPELSDRLPQIPPALERVVRRCLEKQPAQRFRSSADLAFAMENSISSSSSLMGARELEPQSVGTPRRRLSVALALIVLSAAILGILLTRRGPVPSSSLSARLDGPLRKIEILLPSLAGRPVIAPDGKKLVYLDSDGVWLRWLDRVAPPVHLAAPRDGQTVDVAFASPIWAPQSNEVAYFDGADLYRVPIMGGRPRLVCTVDAPVVRRGVEFVGGAWLANDRILFTTGYTKGSGGLSEVSAGGGKPTVALPVAEGEQDFHNCTALPGGRGILFVVHRNNEFPGTDTIAVWSPPNPAKALLRVPRSAFGHPTYASSGHIVFTRAYDDNRREIWAFPFSLEQLERTGEPFRVADAGTDPSVADDGTLAYSIATSEGFALQQLVWLDRSGMTKGTIGAAMAGLSGMRLSPDEGQVVAMAGPTPASRDVWLFDAASGNSIPLTRTTEPESDPFWYPDGRRVLFTSRVTVITAWKVLSKLVDGFGGEEEIATGWAREFSRSGKYLFIRFYPPAAPGAATASAGATWAYVDLTAGLNRTLKRFPDAFVAEDVALSPDDRLMAYSSSETGRSEIFLVNFPDFTNKTRVSRGGGLRMQWHPDGSELFWFTLAERREFWSASIRREGGLQIGDPAKVFELPDSIGVDSSNPARTRFQVTSDGKRFLMAQEVRPPKNGLVEPPQQKPMVLLVENWFEEFRDKK